MSDYNIKTKYDLNATVYYLDYVMTEYDCPYCGEKRYEEAVDSIEKGIVREIEIIKNYDGVKVLYKIQCLSGKPKGVWYVRKAEETVYATEYEATKELEKYRRNDI